jgi:PAS domain S-box-containing protein
LRARIGRLLAPGLLLVLGWSTLVSLVAGSFADREYLIDSWETDQGLPENSATAMVQTPDGYLWFGTFNGLVRFDGVKFTVFDPSNTPELPSPGILNLHLDASQRLWVSTLRGLVVSEPGRWTVFRREPGWTGNYVRTFSENAGVVCATSFNGKVFRQQAGRFEELLEPPGRKDTAYFGHVDRTGRIWIAQNGFYGHWAGSQWRGSDLAGLVTDGLVSLSGLRDGRQLIVKSRELLRLEDERIVSRQPLPQTIPDVWRVEEDRQGTLWLSSHGLFRIRPSGDLRHYSSTNGLTYDSVRFTFEDREENLWVGTSGGGLMRFKPRTFLTYGAESGLSERNVKAIVETGPGTLLIGTHTGVLHAWEEGRISALDARRQPVNGNIQCLLVDRDRNLWVGLYAGEQAPGLNLVTTTERREIPAADTGGGNIRALYQDSRGRIWIGGSRGVSVFADGQFKVHVAPQGIFLGRIGCFAEDPRQGAIWAAGSEGLYQFADGQWREIRDAMGGPLKDVLCLRVEANGALWIGRAGVGLLRLKDGQWSALNEGRGLPTRNISCILEDDLGYWWFGSNRGVLRVLREDLDSVADGSLARLPCRTFNRSDGLVSVECPMGLQSTGLKDSQGRLWFATLKGVAMVDPRNLKSNPHAPPVRLETLSYLERGGKRVDHPSAPMMPAQDQLCSGSGPLLTLPAGSSQLEARFAVLSFAAPEKVSLRYRWLHDGKPFLAGEGTDRTVVSQWLPPGDYQLRVAAANNDGVWNEAGATVAFVVQPFYWQTLWFRILAVLGFGGGIAFAVARLQRTRMRQSQERLKQQQALAEERERAAGALRSSVSLLRATLESTGDGILVVDLEGKIVDFNQRFVELWQLPEELIPAGKSRDLITSGFDQQAMRVVLGRLKDPDSFVAQVKQLYAQPEAASMDVLEFKDGRIIERFSFPQRTAGRVAGRVWSFRDVTERQRAEAVLRESEAFRRRVFDSSRIPIAVMDATTFRIIDCNDAAVEIYRFASREATLGKTPLEVSTPLQYDGTPSQEKARGYIARALAEGTVVFEWRHQRPGGQVWDAEVHLMSFQSGSRQLLQFTLQDITERKRAEAERQALQAQLIQAQKMEAVGQLAGGVAHDFNNILAAVLMRLGLLQQEPDLTPGIRMGLAELEEGALRGANLTRQLLMFSRRQLMQKQLCDLDSLLGNLLKMLRRLIGEHISLEFKGAPEPLWIAADAGMLEQVVMNLVVNARDALLQGGRISLITQRVEFEESRRPRNPSARPGRFVCLTVADTGRGMDEATLKRIFEPFFTTKEPGKGTGLGLATVYGIVQRHEGWIEVESVVGQGTTFRVYFPASLEGAVPAPGGHTQFVVRGGQETVLLVEDDRSLREQTSRALQRAGYRVLQAANGQEALTVWSADPGPVDLLLTDMVMPEGLTGLELAERLRQQKPNLKVIIMSGHSLEIAQQGLPAKDQIVYLPKPFRVPGLSETVRRCLDS